ncbi:MAG: hypothetical protein JSW45_04805 [Thiotrichales bacterium]|nr:MAG: hypothetical protein JSW45_04805 [Thiotrichales bacterium]
MQKTLRKLLRTIFVYYSCICLIGCVTPAAIEYAEEQGETETHHWKVKAVTFAAISDNRFVRMCIEFVDDTETTVTELNIDLQEMTEQLNQQDADIGGLEEGVDTESTLCSLELEWNEDRLPVLVIHSDAQDTAEALQALDPLPPDGPAVILLQHATGNYLVFRAPAGMYEGLDQHVLGTYTEVEQHYSSSIYVLLPIAVAVDVALIAAIVVLYIPCAILVPPLCR